ncbi:hypothetical protein KFK09_028635 [Dendrobium nobile]|uniref:Uncharacterized protein n=1 Tax=Dendrobium nobile TaxID=94219 RepID=A0A8T3A360_DENNO|nr:hypothetical protein KFK09_028635 [Dendrobium nobile]
MILSKKKICVMFLFSRQEQPFVFGIVFSDQRERTPWLRGTDIDHPLPPSVSNTIVSSHHINYYCRRTYSSPATFAPKDVTSLELSTTTSRCRNRRSLKKYYSTQTTAVKA